MLASLRYFDESEVAKERMKIIKFYDQYGEAATTQAFGSDRKVISRWKQRLKTGHGQLTTLVPHKTTPHRTRTPQTDERIVDFIRKFRTDHPRTGKTKLKPDVDEFCRRAGIKTVSESTIGNEIKRHKFFFQKAGKLYHNPASKWAQNQRKKTKRLRIKHSPHPEDYGHILSDTVEKVIDGVKTYFTSAIDAKMKFALTLHYPKLNSVNMKDFYLRFQRVYPGTVRVWQSDNGKENLGVFDAQLSSDHIPHLFIYPRCPQIDTFIERYNRTVQEEFIDYHLDTIFNPEVFPRELADWNIFYNTKRRHHTLGNVSPLQALIEKGGMSQKSLTYTRR